MPLQSQGGSGDYYPVSVFDCPLEGSRQVGERFSGTGSCPHQLAAGKGKGAGNQVAHLYLFGAFTAANLVNTGTEDFPRHLGIFTAATFAFISGGN